VKLLVSGQTRVGDSAHVVRGPANLYLSGARNAM
jgi:hypothetical protein